MNSTAALLRRRRAARGPGTRRTMARRLRRESRLRDGGAWPTGPDEPRARARSDSQDIPGSTATGPRPAGPGIERGMVSPRKPGRPVRKSADELRQRLHAARGALVASGEARSAGPVKPDLLRARHHGRAAIPSAAPTTVEPVVRWAKIGGGRGDTASSAEAQPISPGTPPGVEGAQIAERVRKRRPVPLSSENMPPIPSMASMVRSVCFQRAYWSAFM